MNASPRLPRSLLVTGASGFIGRHIVRAVKRADPAVRIVSLDRTGLPDTAVDVSFRCDLAPERASEIEDIVRRYAVTGVVHCAGSTRADLDVLMRDNLAATALLLEIVSGVRPGAAFCHLGSSAEYQPLCRPLKTSEETPEQPVADYGRVKLLTTRKVIAASGVRGFVLRVFNPIGPGMPATNLVGRVCGFLRDAKASRLTVGSLESYRDFVDVRDVAEAVITSLGHAERVAGQVFNVGSGVAHQTRDLVVGLLSASPRPVSFEESAAGSQRSEPVVWQEADVAKAEQWFEWRPARGFAEAVAHVATGCLTE